MNIPSKYKFWRYPLLLKLRYGLSALLHPLNSVGITYWINANIFMWSTKIKPYNWGDYINLVLAEFISGKKVIPSAIYRMNTNYAMVGSILPWASDENTYIWGSGCLNSNDPLWKNCQKPIKVCAVRGPLTRKVLLQNGIQCPEVYGDPALLFPRFYTPKLCKHEHKRIGVVCHVSSLSEGMTFVHSCNFKKVIFINPKHFSHWQEFIDKICSCDLVLSSSLHGLIIADAYQVPNVWITITGHEHPDNNFKFHDYLQSVGKDLPAPKPIQELDLDNIESYIVQYKKPIIDLDKLLNACPFI